MQLLRLAPPLLLLLCSQHAQGVWSESNLDVKTLDVDSAGEPSKLLVYLPQAHNRGIFSVFAHTLTYFRDNGDRNLPIMVDWSNFPNYAYGVDKGRNLWDDFFEQPYKVQGFNLTGSEEREIYSYMPLDLTEGYGTRNGFGLTDEKLALGRSLVRRFVRFKPEIIEEAEHFRKHNLAQFKKPLAVHIRQTDKISQAKSNFEPKVEFRRKLEAIMKERGYDGFFLASDSPEIKRYLKSMFGDRCVEYHSTLSHLNEDGNYGAVHKDHSIRGFKKAKDVIMEVLLMGSCDAMISTYSCVANGVRWTGSESLAADHHYFQDMSF